MPGLEQGPWEGGKGPSGHRGLGAVQAPSWARAHTRG